MFFIMICKSEGEKEQQSNNYGKYKQPITQLSVLQSKGTKNFKSFKRALSTPTTVPALAHFPWGIPSAHRGPLQISTAQPHQLPFGQLPASAPRVWSSPSSALPPTTRQAMCQNSPCKYMSKVFIELTLQQGRVQHKHPRQALAHHDRLL